MNRVLLFATFVLITSCHQNSSTIDPLKAVACDATQNFAKTAQAALPKLVGNWKLTAITGGWVTPTSIPNVSIDFKVDGSCIVTQDGQASTSVSYSVVDGISAPVLTVNDTTRIANRTQLGRSTLFVCDAQLILDYGRAVDGQANVYQRVNP